jgi:hypothetical protein
VQQHLGRLEGVDKVDVRLADGNVVILARQDSRLDPEKVFKATYDSGVSVVEMTMEATGWLERDAANRVTFRISGTQAYSVVENDDVRLFMEKPKTLGPVRLEVIEVRRQQ